MPAIHKACAHLEEVAGAVLLVAMCVVATIQVAARYVLASPPAWTEEMATILFAWLVFVGASLALKRNEHFAVDVLVELFPRPLRRAVQAAVLLLVLAFCVLLIVYGIGLAAGAWHVTTAVLEIPRTWMYASVPVGGALMLLRTLEALVGWWKVRAKPAVEAKEQP